MSIPKPKEIIKLLKSSSGRPMRSKEISRRLGITKEERPILKKVLRKMISHGKLSRVEGGKFAVAGDKDTKPKTPKHTIRPETTNSSPQLKGVVKDGRVIGKFVRTGKTGKVIPRDGLIPHILLEPKDIKKIRNNSLVVAELQNKISATGRLRGRVIDVLGKAGDLDTEKKGLLVEYDLTEKFSSNVSQE